MRLSLFLTLSSALLATQMAIAQPQAPAPEAATGRATKTLGTAQRFMAAAANPLAAMAGTLLCLVAVWVLGRVAGLDRRAALAGGMLLFSFLVLFALYTLNPTQRGRA